MGNAWRRGALETIEPAAHGRSCHTFGHAIMRIEHLLEKHALQCSEPPSAPVSVSARLARNATGGVPGRGLRLRQLGVRSGSRERAGDLGRVIGTVRRRASHGSRKVDGLEKLWLENRLRRQGVNNMAMDASSIPLFSMRSTAIRWCGLCGLQSQSRHVHTCPTGSMVDRRFRLCTRVQSYRHACTTGSTGTAGAVAVCGRTDHAQLQQQLVVPEAALSGSNLLQPQQIRPRTSTRVLIRVLE